MDILKQIIANTKKEVACRKNKITLKTLENSSEYKKDRLSLAQAIYQKKLAILAEIKFKSPSKGVIHSKKNALQIGKGYEEVGAAGISVLTDETYFAGKKTYLTEVRNGVNIPILQKDFVVEEYQILEARSIGADAILLIAAALTPQKLSDLAKFARNLELEVLLEVHCLEELEKYLTPEINLVGVNNRNLKTFAVNIQNGLQIIEKIPAHYCKLSERSDYRRVLQQKKAGFDGKADPESAAIQTTIMNALIFLSRLKQPNNKYHERFLNLSKGTKITIQAVVSNKKANLVTQNSVKRASNINIFGDNILYLTVLSWQVVQ